MNNESLPEIPAGHPGSVYQELRFQTNNQVNLLVHKYSSAGKDNNYPIIFAGGLSTIIESFSHIINNLTKDFPFYFIETRDHASSLIDGEVPYDVASSGEDIVAIVDALGLKDRGYYLMGYSLGVTLITDCYTKLKTKPLKTIFLEPTPEFHYPGWAMVFLKMTRNRAFKFLKPLGKWYLRNFVINKKGDPEMVRISAKAIDHSDQLKLKKTAIDISGYQGWDKPEKIDCPVLIIAASCDTMHRHDETMRLKSLLQDSRYAELETNMRSHSDEAAELMREFIEEKL